MIKDLFRMIILSFKPIAINPTYKFSNSLKKKQKSIINNHGKVDFKPYQLNDTSSNIIRDYKKRLRNKYSKN